MGLLRDGDTGRVRLQMREKMLSIGDDYWVEDSAGHRVFKVDGKALRVRDTFVLEAVDGHEVAKIQERKLSIRDTMKIDLTEGRHATVKKRKLGIRDHFLVDVDGGADLKVHGNVLQHEYEIERDGHQIAEVSKKWFRVRDTYGVDISSPDDVPLVLAVTVAVDAMARR